MEKARSVLYKAIIPAAVVIVTIFGVGAYGRNGESLNGKRADVIMIDALKIFGKLDRPAVEFLHDTHTKALEKAKKDCTACHLPEKDRLSTKYQRLSDVSKKQSMDIYHARCIECHKESLTSGEKSGPVTCGGCHKGKPGTASVREPAGFDKSLHFRHTKSLDNKCELCHHEYDDQSKKLFYAKGKEGTCRYCHKEAAQENRISYRQAAHSGCIDCHRKTIASGEKSGPLLCSGCHDPKQSALVEKVKNTPRMKRNQPDVVLIKTGKDEIQSETRMNFTPFDHKAHEDYNDTCRVCHHKEMGSCNKCHTVPGSKDGKGVSLENAMHQMDSSRSCKGCHEKQKSDKKCMGCHSLIPKTNKDENSCLKCHAKPPKDAMLPILPEQEPLFAKALLDSRRPMITSFSEQMLKEVPEKVTIKVLSNQYEPSEFPHRKIAQTLLKNISTNKLAGVFHKDEFSICQGCHHNSPASLKPPKCQSCHNKPFNEKNPMVPGLLGAYHQQCMGCHKAMEMESPMGCTECHKEKK